VGGPDVLANLIAQHLYCEARFMAINVRAVNQQTRGFVDRDDVIIAIKDA
jgi:hypothetical protein